MSLKQQSTSERLTSQKRMFRNKVGAKGEGKSGIRHPRTGFRQALESLAESPDAPRCVFSRLLLARAAAPPESSAELSSSIVVWAGRRRDRASLSSPCSKWSLFPGAPSALPKAAGPEDEPKWDYHVLYNTGGHFRATGMSMLGVWMP